MTAKNLGLQSKRLGRRRDFSVFSHHSDFLFDRVIWDDIRHSELKGFYSFYIKPGGRNGGIDHEIVDVFYGSRALHSKTEIDLGALDRGSSPIKFKIVPERGAQLSYQLLPNGWVICLLFPAQTESFSPIEDVIILGVIREPRALTGVTLLNRHWKHFRSLMEVTSVDGEPSIRDHFRVRWLRYTKTRIVDEKSIDAPAWRDVQRAITFLPFFLFIVGLSGWLLKLIENWWK